MAEATAVAERCTGEPCGPGDFLVPSQSDPEKKWTVIWQGGEDRLYYCFCPFYQLRNHCKHGLAVSEVVGAENRAKYRARSPEERAAMVARLEELKEMFQR